VPRPADRVLLLEDREVADAGLLEADGESEAGEPGPDDDDVVVFGQSLGL
jgi:hypothetical protein